MKSGSSTGEAKTTAVQGARSGQVYVYVSQDVLAADEGEGRLLVVSRLQQVAHVLLRPPEDCWVPGGVYCSCEVV